MQQSEVQNHQGVLERIIYFNEENHYCVGEFRAEKLQTTITVTGVLPGVQCGETLNLTGQWEHHPRHGSQFKVTAFKATLPASVYGMRKYLGSGLVPGIGKVYAKKIVDQFGAETLRVISEDSGRLREVPGIGAQRARAIKKSWDQQQAVRDVMMFLQTYGVSSSLCLKIVRKYGNTAPQVLRSDPYKVAREIEGIGFKTADRIAINLGFANDSAARLEAGILHAMQTLENEGHTGYGEEDLQAHAAELLEADLKQVAVHLENLKKNQALLCSEGSTLLQLPGAEFGERKIAFSLHNILTRAHSRPPIKIGVAVDWAEKRLGFAFAPEQAEAIKACLRHKITILTGGPGTGKTTILRALVDIISAKKVKILLASPTGRAAQRMSESCGHFAQTIHRLLKFDPALGKFTVNEDNPLKCGLIVIDEASMLDNRLASALFRAIPGDAQVVLVGDVNQLPSVGAGNVLHDLIACDKIQVSELKQIFRQSEGSGIVKSAHGILRGNAAPPYLIKDLDQLDRRLDLQFVYTPTPEACLDKVKEICRDYIPSNYPGLDPVVDVQVIAPMHRGTAGISNFNRELQKALNPGKSVVSIGSTQFHLGDKVIQTRNNYDKNLFNGDIGKITAVNVEAGTLAADFDGETYDFERLEMTDLLPAFAISVHKSQGSEFPIVILPLLKQHFMMLQRNLLYTAITRGKRKVIIVGDPGAYAMAVNNTESTQRQTDLARKIKEAD